jgi:hypothetical protein
VLTTPLAVVEPGQPIAGVPPASVCHTRQPGFINEVSASDYLQVILTMWRRVLTPVQFAHLNVAAWPAHTGAGCSSLGAPNS